jgi:hypothetical protein
MSFLDLDKLSTTDLIVQYVLECRGAGLFLPYQDYQVIDEWLGCSSDTDALLLVLSEVLPGFFDVQATGKPRSLSGCRRLVLSRLRDQAMRQPGR